VIFVLRLPKPPSKNNQRFQSAKVSLPVLNSRPII